MPALRVVPRLDVAEDRAAGLVARVPIMLHQQLELERREEALRDRVDAPMFVKSVRSLSRRGVAAVAV